MKYIYKYKIQKNSWKLWQLNEFNGFQNKYNVSYFFKYILRIQGNQNQLILKSAQNEVRQFYESINANGFSGTGFTSEPVYFQTIHIWCICIYIHINELHVTIELR